MRLHDSTPRCWLLINQATGQIVGPYETQPEALRALEGLRARYTTQTFELFVQMPVAAGEG